jgi:hypothetical protein
MRALSRFSRLLRRRFISRCRSVAIRFFSYRSPSGKAARNPAFLLEAHGLLGLEATLNGTG